jgi:hypothetical protein
VRQCDRIAALAVRAGLSAIDAKAAAVIAIVSIGPKCGNGPCRSPSRRPCAILLQTDERPERGSTTGLQEQHPLLKRIECWTIERVMASGLYVTPDGKIMVAYGARQIPLSCAQYKANGYKPAFDKLLVKSPNTTVPSVSVLPSTVLGREAGRRV